MIELLQEINPKVRLVTKVIFKKSKLQSGLKTAKVLFIILTCICFNTFAQKASFNLKQAAKTSAGVYTNDGLLIRTLWNVVNYEAGTHTIEWDGKDDNGKEAAAGSYVIKVVSNNVKYEWEGIIGNTSSSQTGSTVHRGFYYFMTGMTVANGTAYYCSGYSEARPSVFKFLTSKPQEKLNIELHTTTTANTDIVVNDGKTIFWAGYDPYAITNTFVFATQVKDDKDVVFSNGTYYKPTHARKYNAISLVNQSNSLISGLAVQKQGDYLFVARSGINRLSIINKNTGALVRDITANSPKALCVDGNDNLWMVTANNTVSKYTVNSDGSLTNSTLTISSVLKPIALAVSPDNTTIAIADGDITSQQVKAFSNSTGSSLWTLGDPGGYMNDATVSNNKFYFNDTRGRLYNDGAPGFLVFIAFEPNGSFWVNDPGNYRVQHYTAGRTFINNIMSLPPSYSTWADKNDIKRVGVEYLEFEIDYSVPVSGNSGWKFVKNWGAKINLNYDFFTKFRFVTTLTFNNVSKTFALLRVSGDNKYEVVELQANNTLRFTNIIKPAGIIDKTGAFIEGFARYSFNGFDSSNNPIWSSTPETLADISQLNDYDPLPGEGFRNEFVTSTDKIICWNYSKDRGTATDLVTGYHLGAIKRGSNKWLWKTEKATDATYSGPYPEPGYFDIGNGVNNLAGSYAMVQDRNIITAYHGEFWKQGQTNKYNHYLDNGLAIGQFGIAKGEFINEEAPAMMAGNTLTPALVKGTNSDELFLWHGDESFHAGMHKWKISGLNTIQEQAISIVYPNPELVPVAKGTDLMIGLSSKTTLVDGVFGWKRPEPEDYTDAGNKFWAVSSGTKSYKYVDVSASYRQSSGIRTVTRDLGINTNINSWSLNGKVNWEYNTANAQNGGGGGYIEILDDAGKVISRFYTRETYTTDYDHQIHIHANDQVIAQDTKEKMQVVTQFSQPFEISFNGTAIAFKYAEYPVVTTTKPVDPTANPISPKTFRLFFWTSNIGENYYRTIDIETLKFVPNSSIQTGGTSIQKTNQSIAFSGINNKSIGDVPFLLNAIASSGLAVAFKIVSGPASINGNTLTLTGTGIVVVEASQDGNTIYNPAPPVSQSFAVNSSAKTNQNILFSSIADKSYGDAPFTVTATATSALPVSYSIKSGPATISGNVVTVTGVGTVSVQADQIGSSLYNAANSIIQTFSVNKQTQAITFPPIQSKKYDVATSDAAANTYDLDAFSSQGLPITYTITSGFATVNGKKLVVTGTGVVIVQAEQSGNSTIEAAVPVLQSFVVNNPNKTDQILSAANVSDKVYGDGPFNLINSSSSGLPVSYRIVSGPATISGNTLTITGAGDITVWAEQPGNTIYNPAAPVAMSFTVTKAAQSLNFPAIPTKNYKEGNTDAVNSFVLNANSDKGLQINYSIVSGPASLNGKTLTLTGPGIVVVKAEQTGNANIDAAQPLTQTFTVNRLVQINSGTQEETVKPAASLKAYPNPIETESTVQFVLPEAGKADVNVYDLNGRLLKTLFSGQVQAEAVNTLTLDRNGLATGLYVIRLVSANNAISVKVIAN